MAFFSQPPIPEKRLEFCEISRERGPRSPAGTPRGWNTPTPGTPPAGARRHSWRGGLCYGGRLPGGGRGYGARGYLRRGGAGAAGGYPKRGGYGAHVGRGYRARANTGAAGYWGKQAAFRGKRGVFPGGYLCRGGAYTGARLPRRAARRHSLPPAGRLPGGCTPGEDHCFPAACDGFSPRQISVCVPPARLPRGAAQKNIFSGARVFVPEYRPRAYCALI